MANVLFISNDPSIFDADSAARQRMYLYAAEIGNVHLLSPAPKGAVETNEGALHLHPMRVPRLLRVPVMRVWAHHLIRKYGIEIVSAQDPFELGLVALSARRGTPAVLHVQVHTDFLSPWFTKSGSWRMNLLNRFRVRLAARVLPKARGIRVVSERIQKSITDRYKLEVRIPSVIPVMVDTRAPEPKPLPPHPFKFALVCVGRLEPEKRIEDILAALALVKPNYHSIGLFVIGAGRERRAHERRAAALALSDSVTFLGNRPDAWALMQSAQAFVQASAYEGYGRTLIEAAVAGVPIVTTEVGVVGEFLRDGKEVLVAPVGDVHTIAKHIETFVEENQTRIALTMAAKEAVEAHQKKEGNIPARIAADLNACLGL